MPFPKKKKFLDKFKITKEDLIKAKDFFVHPTKRTLRNAFVMSSYLFLGSLGVNYCQSQTVKEKDDYIDFIQYRNKFLLEDINYIKEKNKDLVNRNELLWDKNIQKMMIDARVREAGKKIIDLTSKLFKTQSELGNVIKNQRYFEDKYLDEQDKSRNLGKNIYLLKTKIDSLSNVNDSLILEINK